MSGLYIFTYTYSHTHVGTPTQNMYTHIQTSSRDEGILLPDWLWIQDRMNDWLNFHLVVSSQHFTLPDSHNAVS